MSNLTIVMYHYVRDLARSRYPRIKGLDAHLFQAQVTYLKRHYNPISAFDLMDALAAGTALPPRSVLLTFDDGYLDHYTEVFPVLHREGLSGCFFPPAKCILEHQVLDVNKIHFLLASVPDVRLLVDKVFAAISRYRHEFALRSGEEYWAERGIPSRYDTAEVMFVKYMLQRDLPLQLRHLVTDALFREYVSADEAAFSKELYMSPDQISLLGRSGMYVGSHGHDHFHLDSISPAEQKREIDLSLEFMQSIGSDTRRWIMCYPYGAYDDSLLAQLRDYGCAAGLTTRVGIANIETGDPLLLPRLDTNDLPKDANASPVEWTRQAS